MALGRRSGVRVQGRRLGRRRRRGRRRGCGGVDDHGLGRLGFDDRGGGGGGDAARVADGMLGRRLGRPGVEEGLPSPRLRRRRGTTRARACLDGLMANEAYVRLTHAREGLLVGERRQKRRRPSRRTGEREAGGSQRAGPLALLVPPSLPLCPPPHRMNWTFHPLEVLIRRSVDWTF